MKYERFTQSGCKNVGGLENKVWGEYSEYSVTVCTAISFLIYENLCKDRSSF